MYHIITGNPGTGKHTLSVMLSYMLAMPVVDINKEAKAAGLMKPGGTDVDILARHIGHHSGEALLVGHLAPHVVAPYMVSSVTVLRRSPYELEEIYRHRGYTRPKAMANLGAEILDIVAGEAADAFGHIIQVDTTGEPADYSARKVAAAIHGTRPSDDIDWLGMIYRNGDMRRFFGFDK